MRILHTSDWHIGRTFHGVDLLADQSAVLDAIAAMVREHQVDVVVVPGDIYDRAVPSADAVAVCNRGLEGIRAAGAQIVATSGNHDSPVRLGSGAAFAAAGGLHLLTKVRDVDSPVVLSDPHGPVAFYGIPYLEPETTRAELGVPSARTHADILDAAMGRVRSDISARAADGAPARSVVLAHAFVVGAEPSESERSISVGGVETVPASAFDDVDYVALGHLHSPQALTERVRYSGSPLPYSFGERSHRKAVWLIDLDDRGLGDVQRVELPVVRGLSRLSGTLEQLSTDPSFADVCDDYISAELTDRVRPVDAMRVLRERFPHLVHLEWIRPDDNSDLKYRDKVRGRSDAEIVSGFLSDVRTAPTDSELQLVERALANAGRERDGESSPDSGADDVEGVA